jgi:hypothetical protein
MKIQFFLISNRHDACCRRAVAGYGDEVVAPATGFFVRGVLGCRHETQAENRVVRCVRRHMPVADCVVGAKLLGA